MPHGFQCFLLRGGEGVVFDLDMIRQILMVEARAADPLRYRPAIHRLQCAEQHHADDTAATGSAENGQLVRILQHGRGHARQGALARGDGVGLAAGQPVAVLAVRVGGKIIHFVVQQHTGARYGERRAERQVDAQGRGHRITLAVDQREVGGIGAFLNALGLTQFETRRGALGIDAGRQLAGMFRRQQPLGRHGDKIAVAQQQGAVAIGAPHQFDQIVGPLDGAGCGGGQMVETLQDAGQGNAAGRGQWRADHLETAAGKAHGLALDDPVTVQVSLLPDAAGGLHTGNQPLGHRSTVETGMALRCQSAQGGGQLGLADQRIGGGNGVVLQEDARGFGILLHGFQAETDQLPVARTGREALLGGGNRGSQTLFQR